MHRGILACLVLLTLIAAPALAKSRLPVPAPGLTGLEQICRGLGLMVFQVAEARNHGMLLTDVLILLRQQSLAHGQVNEFLDRIGSAVVYDLYGNSAHVQPAQGQRVLETLCITQGLGAVLQLYALDVTTPTLVR